MTDAAAVGRFLEDVIASEAGYPIGGPGGYAGGGPDAVASVVPIDGDYARLRLVTELGCVFEVRVVAVGEGEP